MEKDISHIESQDSLKNDTDLNKANSQIGNEENLEEALEIFEVVKRIAPNVQNLPAFVKENLIKEVSATISVSRRSHSGPLPDIDTIRGYNQEIPDGGNRVMIMAEKEQEARLKNRSYINTRMFNQSIAGQAFGFVLAVIAITGGIYLSAQGKETAGLSTVITSLTGIVGVFVYNKYMEKKDTN